MVKMTAKNKSILEYALLTGIILFVNIICTRYFFRIDLTDDKRYSLSQVSKDMLGKLDDVLYVEVYLEGEELSADNERLQRSIREKLEEFKAFSGDKIQYRFVDPSADPNKVMRTQMYQSLVDKGIKAFSSLQQKDGARQEVIIFPGAVLSYKEKEVAVNFYQPKKFVDPQLALNQSVEGIEFELASGIKKLTSSEFKNIAFVSGHGELNKAESYQLTTLLSESYNMERVKLDTALDLSRFSLVMIAKPDSSFTEKEKFILDQYVVKGGNVLMFIDATDVRQDSLKGGQTFALLRDKKTNVGGVLNLEDLLFKWGVRLNENVVQDLQSCGRVPVVTGLNGETQELSFPYYPILKTFGKSTIVKNLDAIYSKFTGTIDTIAKTSFIKKTPLVMTSQYSRAINAPMPIDLDALRKNQDPELFNQSHLTVCYLLEGKFKSLYANKISPISGVKPLVQSDKAGKVIVFADGDVVKNDFDPFRGQPLPLGFDMQDNYEYSNKDFVKNAVDYLMGEDVISVRSKEVVLRPLDKVRISDEKLFWQVVNLVIPVLLIIGFGMARFWWRKKKYEQSSGK